MAKNYSLSLQTRAKAELLLRKRIESNGLQKSKYEIFQDRYRFDPAGFIRDCVDWGTGKPTAYQEEIASSIPIHKRVSVRAPHGSGKTGLVGLLVLWYALVMDGWTDWKIPITASAWRQLSKFAMPEVHKWSRRLKWDVIGREPFNERLELLQLSLKLKTGEAFALASDNAAMIEGAHASYMFYIFDESKEIPVTTWDAAEGAFSSGTCWWLSVSTPGEPAGRFYDIQSRQQGYEDWYVRHITLQEAMEAGRILPEWAESRKLQWGEKSAVYINRVEGNFASSEEDGVIPLRWIEIANERWNVLNDSGEWGTFKCVGVDVARSGMDKTVEALRFGNSIKELRRFVHADLMETSGRVAAILNKYHGYANIDVIGIGAGVYDRLREQKYEVSAFNASERTERRDISGEWGFLNVRSAGWWNLREMLDPSNAFDVALPPEDSLTTDLVSVHWKVMSGGKIQIESKDDIKKIIGRSTDDGDAVVMALFDDAQPSASEWIRLLQSRNETLTS